MHRKTNQGAWGACIWLMAAAGCASTPGAKPDDMGAEEHRAAAAQEQAEAEAHEAQYDPDAQAKTVRPEPGERVISTQIYNPTEAHLRHAKTHRQHAADHEAAAKELEAFEEVECGRFGPEVRRTCPLMGKVASIEDIQRGSPTGGPAQTAPVRGIRIHFAPGVNKDAVIAHMRCHLAFARKTARKGMDHCPLYIEGVAIAAAKQEPGPSKHGVKGHAATSGKGNPPGATAEGTWRAGHVRVESGPEADTVDLLVDDDTMLEELRKRARAHMPQGE